MDEDRQALIDLVLWYRDEYHRKDFGHSAMIQEIRTANDLEPYWQIVDGWLD